MNQLEQVSLAAPRRRRGRRRAFAAVVLVLAIGIAVATMVRMRVDKPVPTAPTGASTPVPASPSPSVALPADRPGPSNTGVPAGITLRPSESLIVTVAGTVIDGLDIDGCVDVKANDVVIRRSRISCSRPTTAIRQWTGSKGMVVEDVEIDGGGVVSAAIGFSSYTLRRLDIHNVVDGPRMASNTLIEDSWIHDLARVEGSHNDAIQTTGGSNVVIRGNSLEVYDAARGDFHNAAIMIGSTTAAEVRDMLVEDNYLDGGNYTVNFRKDLVAANIVYRNNKFGRNARYGPVAGGRKDGVVIDDSNVWADTGNPVSDGSHKKPRATKS